MSMNATAHEHTLDVVLAGVQYDGRADYARMVSLSDTLYLQREPDNSHDSNAIQVITSDGAQVGYIPRKISTWLAGWLDTVDTRITCDIVELREEPGTENVRVRVKVIIPQLWRETAEQTVPDERREMEYTLQIKPYGVYLLMNGLLSQVDTIKDVLTSNGIAVHSAGYSMYPADTGKFYEWTLKLDINVDTDRVRPLLQERLNLIADEVRLQQAEESRKEYQNTIQRLQSEVRSLKKDYDTVLNLSSQSEAEKQSKIELLQSEIDARERQIKQADDERRQMEYQIESLRGTLQDQRERQQDALPQNIEQILLDFVAQHLSPCQMLELLRTLFPTRVIVLDSACRSAEQSDGFRHRRTLFELLWLLANNYWLEMCNGKSDDIAGQCFGSSFSAHESGQTRENSTTRNMRTYEHDGKSYYMQRHLKIGVRESINETIRVHFDWDAEKRKIIIGHCGRHLPLG